EDTPSRTPRGGWVNSMKRNLKCTGIRRRQQAAALVVHDAQRRRPRPAARPSGPELVPAMSRDDEAEPQHSGSAAEDTEQYENNGPDDALGLYLRQMGAIPLLNRE